MSLCLQTEQHISVVKYVVVVVNVVVVDVVYEVFVRVVDVLVVPREIKV